MESSGVETVEGANSSTTVSLVAIRKVDVAKFLFRIIYIIINQFLHLSCMGVAEINVKRMIWLTIAQYTISSLL